MFMIMELWWSIWLLFIYYCILWLIFAIIWLIVDNCSRTCDMTSIMRVCTNFIIIIIINHLDGGQNALSEINNHNSMIYIRSINGTSACLTSIFRRWARFWNLTRSSNALTTRSLLLATNTLCSYISNDTICNSLGILLFSWIQSSKIFFFLALLSMYVWKMTMSSVRQSHRFVVMSWERAAQ